LPRRVRSSGASSCGRSASDRARIARPSRRPESDATSRLRQAATRSAIPSSERISNASSAEPSIRALSSSGAGSKRPWKSKLPPPLRKARNSSVRDCWVRIQARSPQGSSASVQACPSGLTALAAMCSRSRGHSSAAELNSVSGAGMLGRSRFTLPCYALEGAGGGARVLPAVQEVCWRDGF
jgi:hypothetical protein